MGKVNDKSRVTEAAELRRLAEEKLRSKRLNHIHLAVQVGEIPLSRIMQTSLFAIRHGSIGG